MRLIDRLQTIAVTATLTSAAWIVLGTFYVDRVGPIDPVPPSAAPTPGASAATPNERVVIERPDSAATDGLLIPVAGVSAAQLSDTFNDERGSGEHLHEALDIMAPLGTPVLAAAAGKVERLFHSDAGGNTLYIRSPDRKTIHYYAHLDHYAADLREGQEVERGQVLGAVGSTGDASPDAPHLHFAIMRTTPDAAWYEPATAIDPYPLLTGKRATRVPPR